MEAKFNAEFLAKVVKDSKMTPKEISSKVGITYTGLWKMLNGKGTPTAENLFKISMVFGIPMERFFQADPVSDAYSIKAICFYNMAKQMLDDENE